MVFTFYYISFLSLNWPNCQVPLLNSCSSHVISQIQFDSWDSDIIIKHHINEEYHNKGCKGLHVSGKLLSCKSNRLDFPLNKWQFRWGSFPFLGVERGLTPYIELQKWIWWTLPLCCICLQWGYHYYQSRIILGWELIFLQVYLFGNNVKCTKFYVKIHICLGHFHLKFSRLDKINFEYFFTEIVNFTKSNSRYFFLKFYLTCQNKL